MTNNNTITAPLDVIFEACKAQIATGKGAQRHGSNQPITEQPIYKGAEIFGPEALLFEVCCEEHDLAYEQIETEIDRVWADAHFIRCMQKHGYKNLGYFFNFLIRMFGWLSFIVKWIIKS